MTQNENDIALSTEELESLMNSAEEIAIIEEDELEKPKREHTDFSKMRREATRDAKNIIKKLIAFYLSTEMAQDKYTIKKVSVDISNLSNCIFQLNTSEYAYIKALEEIDAGIVSDRMFKVITDLQKQNMEIMKYNKQYIQIMEQEYANFSSNFQEYKHNANGRDKDIISIQTSEKNVYRGTKGIIESMQKDKEN